MIIKLTQAHIIGAFISYLVGVFIVPFVIEFSQKEGLVDLPNARKIHKVPISRLGGIAVRCICVGRSDAVDGKPCR